MKNEDKDAAGNHAIAEIERLDTIINAAFSLLIGLLVRRISLIAINDAEEMWSMTTRVVLSRTADLLGSLRDAWMQSPALDARSGKLLEQAHSHGFGLEWVLTLHDYGETVITKPGELPDFIKDPDPPKEEKRDSLDPNKVDWVDAPRGET